MNITLAHIGKWTILSIALSFPIFSYAQAIATSAGNWDNSSIWSSGNIGDNLETVTFNNSIGTVVLRDGFSYTVGSIAMGNANTLTINGLLNIGDNANPANLTANNGCTITIGSTGEVIIWGNLTAFNNLSFGLGKLTIKGNLDVKNGADIDISGTVQIDGDFLADNNTTVNIGPSGNLNVDGEYNVGNGSVMTGTGSASGDPCTGPADFCIFSPLPVKLTSFTANSHAQGTMLSWTTASELNNDYFEVRKSIDGINFYSIGQVNGNGTTNKSIEYSFIDEDARSILKYYQLNQVDFDGSNELSKVIIDKSVSSTVSTLLIYPNPVTRAFQLIFPAERSIVSLKILDVSGKIRYDFKDDIQTTLGASQKFILPEQLESGLYFLQYQFALGEIQQERLVFNRSK